MTQHEREAFRDFTIDAASPVPPYRQVHDRLAHEIATGAALPGDRLPTVRALASRLGIAVNTVAAAYRSLEDTGLTEGRGRAGTFITADDDPLATAARRITREAAVQLRRIGVTRSAALKLANEAITAEIPE